jgi:hypothetical protein
MSATKTKTRSPLQPVEDFGSVLVVTGSTLAPENAYSHGDTRYVEFVNAERTVAVVSNNGSGYAVAVKTDLAVEQVLDPGSYVMTHDGYANTRANGIWYLIKDSGDRSKVRTRTSAEALLAKIQDVEHPLNVSLDGSFAPALAIVQNKVATEPDWRQSEALYRGLFDLEKVVGVDRDLLFLAVKEDRLTWSTPPVAPKQYLVVVHDEQTGTLTERVVDEVVKATGYVAEGQRIVHEGSVAEFLLVRRDRKMVWAIREIHDARSSLDKALASVTAKVESMQEDLNKGSLVTQRGFAGKIHLADAVEEAQAAATRLTDLVNAADLPWTFKERLIAGEFKQTGRYTSGRYDDDAAAEALAALNGMDLKSL